MSKACSRYGREARRIPGFGVETYKEKPLGRPKLDGRILLKLASMKWDVIWTK